MFSFSKFLKRMLITIGIVSIIITFLIIKYFITTMCFIISIVVIVYLIWKFLSIFDQPSDLK